MAFTVLAAPVLGAVAYLQFKPESDASYGAVMPADKPSPTARVAWDSLETLELNGDRFAMAGSSRTPTILYYWATWCPHGRVQREVLSTLSREWGDGSQIVAL